MTKKRAGGTCKVTPSQGKQSWRPGQIGANILGINRLESIPRTPTEATVQFQGQKRATVKKEVLTNIRAKVP